MTNQASRIRSCLAIVLLATFAALAGCSQDRGACCPPRGNIFGTHPHYSEDCCPDGDPCSGYHTTDWEVWRGARMATLHYRDDCDTVPLDSDTEGRTGPTAAVAPVPEAVPRPKAQPIKEPTAPDLVEPSRSSLLPKKATDKGEAKAIPQAKAQAGKEPTAPNLAEPPIGPPPKKATEKGPSPELPQDPPQDKAPGPINKTNYQQTGDGLKWY